MILKEACKRTIERFSAFQVTDSRDFDFPEEKYSKFKFGATNIAREFGYTLADKFINQLFKFNYEGRPIVVLPSAYSHIPTASYFMAIHFIDKLNEFLYQNGYSPVEIGKIHRNVTYREDYGDMSAEERYNLIKGDKFHIDEVQLKNKILIFIDDIKITGTHERIIIKMLDDFDIHNYCYMLYFAELNDPKISPKIENHLNHFYVNELADLQSIIDNNDFKFNTRIVKYILNSKKEMCFHFLQNQNTIFLKELYFNALGNEYYKFPEYLGNLKTIEILISG
ncbi:MAG: phosphoribosyltransferase family protein [Mariniphaga sp.]